MTRVSAIEIVCILAATVSLLGAGSSKQADGRPAPSSSGPSNPGIYLPPNEQHPARALPIYRKSNHGVYVSVGTERSFLGASLARYDPLALRFAEVNRALLAASSDRANYINLRLTALCWMTPTLDH